MGLVDIENKDYELNHVASHAAPHQEFNIKEKVQKVEAGVLL